MSKKYDIKLNIDPKALEDMNEAMKQAAEKLNQLMTQSFLHGADVIASPSDVPKIKQAIRYERNPDTQKISDINIISSPYLEEGTAYLIERQPIQFPQMQYSFDLNEEAREYIYRSFGIPYHLFHADCTPIQLPVTKQEWESFMQWSNRLDLDVISVRMVYQKEVLRLVFVVPFQMLIKFIKKVLHE